MNFEEMRFKQVEVGRGVTEKEHIPGTGNSNGQDPCHRGTKARGLLREEVIKDQVEEI